VASFGLGRWLGAVLVLLTAGPGFAQTSSAPPPADAKIVVDAGMHTAGINAVAADAACTLLATGSTDKTVRLWQLPDGNPIRTLRLPNASSGDGEVYAVAVAPNRTWVAAAGALGSKGERWVYVFAVASGAVTARLGPLPNIVNELAVSADGRYLAATLRGGDGLRVWQQTGGAASWKLIAEDKDYGGKPAFGVTFAGNGALYTVAYDRFVRRYAPPFTTKPARASVNDDPYAVAVDPSGTRLAVAFGSTTRIGIYDAATLTWRLDTDSKNADKDEFRSLAWSRDGDELYAGSSRTIRVWNRHGEHARGKIVVPAENIQSLAPCGDAVAMGASDPAFALVNMNLWRPFWHERVHVDMRDKLRENFTMSADALRVRFGLGSGGQEPVIFDLARKQLSSSRDPEPTLYAPDIEGLPVTDWEDKYDPKLADHSLKLEASERARSMAIAPDKQMFVLGTDERLIAYAKDGKELWRKRAPGVVWGVNIARNGDMLVAAYGDGTLRWHRLSDGTELLALFVHAKDRRWAAWTPNGYYAASLVGGEKLIGWQIDRNPDATADFIPVAKFADKFYRPDLIARVPVNPDEASALAQPDVSAQTQRQSEQPASTPPVEVRILWPADRSITTSGEIELKYAVRARANVPIQRVYAIVNGRPQAAAPHPQFLQSSATEVTGQIRVDIPPGNVAISVVAEAARSKASANIALLANAPAGLTLPHPSDAQETGRVIDALMSPGEADYASLKKQSQSPALKPGKDVEPPFAASDKQRARPAPKEEKDEPFLTVDYTPGFRAVSFVPGVYSLDRGQVTLEHVYEQLNVGDYDGAERDARLLLELHQRNADEVLGYVLYRRGRLHEAENLYRQMLADALQRGSNIARYMALLARVRWAMSDRSGAETLYRRALDLKPDNLAEAPIANELARLYLAQGRYADAERLARTALSVDQFGGEDFFGANLASDHHVLGLIARNQFQWDAAYQNFREAYQVGTRREERSSKEVRTSWIANAREVSDVTQSPFGLEAISAAFELGRSDPKRQDSLRAESFVLAQSVSQTSAASALARMAARFAAGTDDFAEALRERQDLARESTDVARELRQIIGEAPRPENQAKEQALREHDRVIEQRKSALDDQLKQYPQFFAFATTLTLGIDDARSLLRPQEALVQFLLSDPDSFAWVVTKTDARWVKLPWSAKQIDSAVQILRCGLDYDAWETKTSRCPQLVGVAYGPEEKQAGKPLPFHLAWAHLLYKALFEQMADLIDDKQLLIVPSGSLNQLPPGVLVAAPPNEALPASSAGYRQAAWLARDRTITVLPAVSSLRALRSLAKERHARDPYLGFGDPLLEGDPTKFPDDADAAKRAREAGCASVAPEQASLPTAGSLRAHVRSNGGLADVADIRTWVPLPETADELCQVAQNLGADPATHVYIGARATESEVKALSKSGALAGHEIVHFATHGALAGDVARAFEPGLILTPPGTATETDDGYLTASEITDLKLDADIVILSACNTAAGSTNGGEALSGLARAFFYAGARSLLVSHWDVASEPTVELITKMVAELKAAPEIGRAEALRRSILSMIDNGRDDEEAHPAVWAPFVLVGEGGAGR
jgi:CHAT domain-containing protein/WD40 repeat protein/tetratricopeptide (TPR) repeat protein